MTLRKPNSTIASAASTGKPARCASRFGFTVLEMLTVIVIISIIAGVSLPAVRGLSHSHVMTSASQQLADDLALARHMAINYRTTVFVIFAPTNLYSIKLPGSPTPGDISALRQLWGKTFTSYALYVDRMAGDQPGQGTPRYLTEWKTLPEGVFVAASAYDRTAKFILFGSAIGLISKSVAAFPLSTSTPLTWDFPCVAFGYTGTLVDENGGPLNFEQVIPLARGSVFYARDANGNLINSPPDVLETPAGNSVTSYSRIRINHLTGHCRIEKPVIP